MCEGEGARGCHGNERSLPVFAREARSDLLQKHIESALLQIPHQRKRANGE